MARTIIVGSSERKGSFCPQCRRKVPKGSRLETGVHCPRCGFTSWDGFKKFKSLDAIPVPTPKEEEKAKEFFEEGTLIPKKKKEVKK